MTLFWYDAEFLEDGTTIDLISIGFVREDGATYYAVNSGADWTRIQQHPWLMRHVVPHLPMRQDVFEPNLLNSEVKTKSLIAKDVYDFLTEKGSPELWAYYCSYDHVALMQLWGSMVDRPPKIPMLTYDLKQEADRLQVPSLPQQSTSEHHALFDALHDRRIYFFLKHVASRRGTISE